MRANTLHVLGIVALTALSLLVPPNLAQGADPLAAGTPTYLILSRSSTVAPADGTGHTTITASVYDAYSNPVSGVNVTFTTDLGALGIVGAVTTDVNGRATDNITSTSAGKATVTATTGSLTRTSHIIFTSEENPVISVASGAQSGYALKSDGTVWAWGDNEYFGQLGNNSTINADAPVQVSGITDVASITGGYYAGYALKKDGTVWAWGNNESGQLGNNSTTDSHVPILVTGLSEITAISGSASSGYALKADGTVWAWGYNGSGQLGNNSTADSHVPVQVSDLNGVTAIASGIDSGYALKADGTVWAWGYNRNGELGNDTTADSLVPVQVSGLAGIVAIDSSFRTGYALRLDGTVWAWGYNGNGQLGNNSTSDSLVPVQVSGISGVTVIGAAWINGYAVKSDGTAWAWGFNLYGQLGNNSTIDSHIPMQVSGISGAVSMAGGNASSYALKSDGSAWAWGANNAGQLGCKTPEYHIPVHIPVQIVGLGTVPYYTISRSTSLSGGPGNISCDSPILRGETSKCTFSPGDGLFLSGLSDNGVDKMESVISNSYSITNVQANHDIVATFTYMAVNGTCGSSNGGTFTTAPATNLCSSGTAYVINGNSHPWRWTCSGAFGGTPATCSANAIIGAPHYLIVTRSPSLIPADGSGRVKVTATVYDSNNNPVPGVVINFSTDLGVLETTGALSTDINGRATNTVTATSAGKATVAASAGSLTNTGSVIFSSTVNPVMAIAAGWGAGFALKHDGTVWVWGNSYQLGNNSTSNSPVPVQVPGLTSVTAIAGGHALKLDGTVWEWGYNAPEQVSGLTDVTAIAGEYALKSDGTVWAWGDNYFGQLGNNSTIDSLVPVQVSGLTGVTAIAAGHGAGYALKADGTVWAWGFNDYGQLGNGSVYWSSVPVQVSNLTGVTAIAAGYNYAYAMTGGGSVWGWGENYFGVLGTNPNLSIPGQVFGPGATAITGGSDTGYALTGDGTVWAWGGNEYGQLGTGHPGFYNPLPTQVSPLTSVMSIVSAGTSGYALKSDGTVWAWGNNEYGQLGNNSTTNNPVPVQVIGVGSATFTINASVVGGNGSISCDSPVAQGGTTNCTITPSAGYHLATFTDNSVDVLSSIPGITYIIADVQTDHNIVGTFAANPVMPRDGDIIEDGKIDIRDALKALRITVKLDTATVTQLARGDCAPLGTDGKPAPDGLIDIRDALLILKRCVGLVSW